MAFDTYMPRLVLPKEEAKAAAALHLSDPRSDGRSANQLRPVFLQTGVVSQAAGSAYVELSQTKVVCSIYGPRQAKRQQDYSETGKFSCDFQFAPFAAEQRKRRGLNPAERHFSSVLVQALEASIQLDKFPKSVVDAYVMVLEDGGSVLAASITCVSLALADAGLDMFDLVAATSSVYLDKKIFLDPSVSEETIVHAAGQPTQKSEDSPEGPKPIHASDAAALVVSYMPSLKQVTYLELNGCASDSTISTMSEFCVSGCEKLGALMREALAASTVRRMNNEAQVKAALGITPKAPETSAAAPQQRSFVGNVGAQ